jgi:hypothetical protein
MLTLVATSGSQCSGNITSSRASLWHSCVVEPNSGVGRDADEASHNGYAIYLNKEEDFELGVDNSVILKKSSKAVRI